MPTEVDARHAAFRIAGPRLIAAAIALGLTSVLCSGCFDLEQTLTLDRHLAGKASVTVAFDVDSASAVRVKVLHIQLGDERPPRATEFAQAKTALLKAVPSPSSSELDQSKHNIADGLPKGVTLIDGVLSNDGVKVAAAFSFGFDDPSKLSQVQVTGALTTPEDPPDHENPADFPFGGLRVVDEGTTVLVTCAVPNPIPLPDDAAQRPAAEVGAAVEKMADLFAGLRFGLKITAPFAVIEHNATRKDGDTLVWEFDTKGLVSMTAGQSKQAIRVRYQK
jgi:hypothetical protein